jgi:hypothetical protein
MLCLKEKFAEAEITEVMGYLFAEMSPQACKRPLMGQTYMAAPKFFFLLAVKISISVANSL